MRYTWQMSLLKAMATVGGLTGVSRIAGFTRDILMASILGAGPIADAFFVALKLPNFFRRVTAEGAFSVSFLPLYAGDVETKGRAEADHFASNVFMVMLSALSLFTIIAMLAMPYIIHVIAPGFNDDPVRFDAAVELSLITFPYLLLMSLVALLGGILNTHDKFSPFAAAPILFNGCLIAALLLSDMFETAGHALSYGVLSAGVIQLVYLFAEARRNGFRLKIAAPRFDGQMKELLCLMGPGVLGAGVMHVNLFADVILASFLDSGSISYLYYADRLNQLPLGIVGIAIGTALLPMLSKSLAAENYADAKALFNKAMRFCLFFALPAATALIVIPLPIISALFERGNFDSADSSATALVLTCYAIGLPAYMCIKVFSTAHWARKDTKTPVKISILATAANIALSILFIQFMGVAGIALGTGLTAWLQVALHYRALKSHPAVTFDLAFVINLGKLFSACAFMACVLFGIGFFGAELQKIVLLISLVIGGLCAYALAILASGAVQLSELNRIFKRT